MAAFAWNDVLPITLGLWHVWWDERKSCDWLYILTVQGFLPFLECPTTTLENQNSSFWNAACSGSPGDLALIFKIPREILGTPTLTPKFRAREAVFKVRGVATNSFEAVGGRGGANLAVLSFWLFRTFSLMNLSWVIVERSHVAESTFLLLSLNAHAGSTTRSLQIMASHCRFL